MTRINVGIHPAELPIKMLIAEHREIKRIPNCIKSGRYSLDGIPSKFTLGAGHVKFFYNKLAYLRKRYELIYLTCTSPPYRFNVQYYGASFDGLPDALLGDYEPTMEDRALLVQRLHERGVDLPMEVGYLA